MGSFKPLKLGKTKPLLLGNFRPLLTRAGVPPKKEEIEKAVREGRVAFGMAIDHVEQAVPMLVEAIKRYRSSQ